MWIIGSFLSDFLVNFFSVAGVHWVCDRGVKIFSFVFIILIGFEMMETIEMYFKKNVVHAEVVLLVAVIAVTRKVILLDLEKYDPVEIIGLGIIILSLGACYYLIKRTYRQLP